MNTALIRSATDRDAEEIQAIYAVIVRTTVTSFEVEPPTTGEMRERMNAVQQRFPWLVWEQDGEVAGYVYASAHRERAAYQWSVNVSAYIHEQYRRRGVGRALYTSLFALLRLQGFYNAYAGVTLPNPGSVGLHEAMGFEPVGVYQKVGYKFGAWHDVGWWSMALRPHDVKPSAPLLLAAIARTPEWQRAIDSGLAIGAPGSRPN
ncbi:arsinothricin resistance N-acetyltransferase ArsN1 family B [Luteolibacter sp. Populi]|uniref:arsinothricin resistance N-acetyltransferase ArsN1 family B n=1 Tax=Luteolibacter sp. Populi TaxID=3230487 RepID=UPI00346565E7